MSVDKEKQSDIKVHTCPIEATQPAANAQQDVAGVFISSIVARDDADELLAPPSLKETKALLRKADLIIVTLLQFALSWSLHCIQNADHTVMGSVDKVAIGSAAVLGMRKDAKLVGQEYAWTSAIIYFGAIVAIIPSLVLMQRLPTNLYISTMVLAWGVITCCLVPSRNFADLMGVRLLLGLFESVIFAGFGLIISMWYTRDEQPFRTAIVFSTLSSVMNGLLATACVQYKGTALAQWQLLFLLVGLITSAWSLLMFWLLPANPTTAWWLTMRQRVIATRRMTESRTGMENKTFKVHQAVEALVDPKTWFYFLINIALNIPNGGMITFNSIIVQSLGFSLTKTTLLGIPTGIISWISSLVFGYCAVKTGQRCYSAVASCLIPFIGTILLYKIPRTNTGGSLASLYLVYFYWGPYIIMMGAVYANTAGHTKKMIVYAIGEQRSRTQLTTAYIGYCVGNIVGPQTFKAKQAPQYTGGIIAMLSCYGCAIVLIFIYRMYLVHLNRDKEGQKPEPQDLGPQDASAEIDQWQDLTDLKNPRFIYKL
ncbi:uncharacterized protein EHS24_003965 [Apiotrichum porosum]|uniref:Major facilitator superfamily (MFS) profile domain-containing protein n=1 Tax=Apiotrichum porosum TaxID=105984 RepID=A0A427XE85_9TREE|nr:uncharacterized protein EHS24_003965 [Apiotrichum porosum]RSH77024.1 hypothetical protein EHS24_003965 [Apiotrichum porosum]